MARVAVIFLVLGAAGAEDYPKWGCGLVGGLPGIGPDGSTTAEMQKIIDGIKVTSDFNKVTYWNWNLAPQYDPTFGDQYLSKDFLFVPDQWGVGVVLDKYVRPAGQIGYNDSQGQPSPSQMADLFLGANEPDIYGSCMGGMMGACTAPCGGGDCPPCHLEAPPGSEKPNPAGQCNCWEFSHATGVGFWPVPGCNVNQPLPELWSDHAACGKTVIDMWRQTAKIAVNKGYKYLSTPLIASNMDWLRSFITAACDGCSDISCGCPTHIAWHFYASDCRPTELGAYKSFQDKLDATVKLMDDFPFLKGAIVNEVGMLNCKQTDDDPICIPNGPHQKYPGIKQPGHTCPPSAELPNGMSSFLEHLLGMIKDVKAKDGRDAIVAFSWFNLNMNGGTYDLRIFNDDGSVNSLGETYIKACQAWAGPNGNKTTDNIIV